jgi:putative cell wall-binding protein
VAVGLLAGALTVFGLAFAPSAGATADATVDRVAGATRYGTAAAVATEAYEDGADCVLIATGEGFADALAASGLAGSEGCPILLVQQNSIPEETSAAIDDLGASSATIVGGTAAVSQEVEDSLSDDLGLTVDRVAGTDRYETAGEVADAIGSTSGTVIVASGEVAADALAAGPIAANLGAPILLAQTNNVPVCPGFCANFCRPRRATCTSASEPWAAGRTIGLVRREVASTRADSVGQKCPAEQGCRGIRDPDPAANSDS